MIVYQPQVDDWQNFTDIKWRAALQLTPSGGNQDKQNMSQDRSSGGYSSQSLDSEKQSRETGSAQSQHYGSSGSGWGGSHSMGGYGGGGRSWGGGGGYGGRQR